MTVSQKRAIWYTVRKKQLEAQKGYLLTHNLMDEFKQSNYKSMTWFLKSKGIYM